MCRVDELAVEGHDEPVAAMLDWVVAFDGAAAPLEVRTARSASAGGVSSTGLSLRPGRAGVGGRRLLRGLR